MRSVGRLVISLFIVAVVGCSHSLEVKNLASYRSLEISVLDEPVTIGLISTTEDVESMRLVKSVGSVLSKEAKVLLPYSPRGSETADVIARIRVVPRYEGSGWNFLINFPGFIIFTPAWHGYNYKANYDIDIVMTDGSTDKEIDSFSVPISLDLRQADIGRTWTEISWFEVGIIAFIGGLVFVQYDDDITPAVMDKIEGPVGDYVGQQILQKINNRGP